MFVPLFKFDPVIEETETNDVKKKYIQLPYRDYHTSGIGFTFSGQQYCCTIQAKREFVVAGANKRMVGVRFVRRK